MLRCDVTHICLGMDQVFRRQSCPFRMKLGIVLGSRVGGLNTRHNQIGCVTAHYVDYVVMMLHVLDGIGLIRVLDNGVRLCRFVTLDLGHDFSTLVFGFHTQWHLDTLQILI